MFTAEQLKAAHGKVKSGADFPAYIQEIKALGVSHYEAYVSNGCHMYHGIDGHSVKIPEKYDTLTIADDIHPDTFRTELLAHQQGKTDYITFIQMCAETGIEKWKIDINQLTCTYFDTKGNEVLTEHIPQ